MNYYEHHLGDHLRDTAHLSALEEGLYRRMIDRCYINEGPLPLAIAEVCRIARANSKSEREAVDSLLREFFVEGPEGWRHKRCDREIARFQDKRRKAAQSAEARWGNVRQQSDGNANASAEGMRTHSEGNATHARSQAPNTSHQSPDTSHQAPSGGDPPGPLFAEGADAPPAAPARKPAKGTKTSKSQTPTAAVWAAYATAYEDRYKAQPVRNSRTNGQLAQFVSRLGVDEAPSVAAFYVAHPGSFYARSAHAVGPMLKDAEKLRTEWFTGKAINLDARGNVIEDEETRRKRTSEKGKEILRRMGPGDSIFGNLYRTPEVAEPTLLVRADDDTFHPGGQ